jgi:O-methyltransferase
MSPEAADEASARSIRAAGPGPDPEALRVAYLDLLKLCLCDVAGAGTRQVTWTGDKRVFSRELVGEEQLDWRTEGKDWPLDGLTMIGLKRLDDLQACVESVIRDGIPGDLIEAGAWRGGASILIRATLDTLGAVDRTLWVADSFEGFPVPEEEGVRADLELESDMSRIDFLAPTLETVRGYFARFGCDRGVRFLPGFFEDTMSDLRGRRWSLLRLDADTHKATKLLLECLYPGLAAGGCVIVDDYFHPFLPESCRKAVDEFRREHGVNEPIEQIDWNGARWRREAEPPERPDEVLDTPDGEPNHRARRLAATRPRSPIPTARELELTDAVAALESRLHALEAQLETLTSSRRPRWRKRLAAAEGLTGLLGRRRR